MGLYLATLNTPYARRGKTVVLSDDDPNVRKMVLFGHLIPRDEEAKEAQNRPVVLPARGVSKADQVRKALAEAKAKAAAAGTLGVSSVSTSVPAARPGLAVEDDSVEASPSVTEGDVGTASAEEEVPDEAKPKRGVRRTEKVDD